ncbi:helix-turn-helix domain-containing protein [Streptomyces somaliensis DSM 40738]|uniref:Helix-turn-helix transcriptional regulator n=1 Tax=Streptomyces somaliensis (strain ATCC 33201 / DSM 40738 / JCM 12659 / KCTC 9044 / NCTC 11332 / NRRL B-12077 / IP 733) TaxID=1134445 RepID=A0AA44DFJ3_STRE0|nr:helix-turn-helix domain-containing protein [Streptomyces somaliensis]MCQ0025001.1 helix-turn-helix domain-containing protein [Streptomyces somaliensis DSM 40738]NKY15887.1 helix-turn-helix transcriptional regulator [Streptomyces somaliensis DSM 40738]
MLTVHFTHEDIANAYMSPVARPEAEALYALGHLERSARQSRGAGRWVTHARAWVAARPSRHPVLQHALRISDDLMPLLLSRRAPDRGAAVPEGTRRALAALAEFRKACITPYETSIREILDETRHRYSNMVARLGLAETLERLQCKAKWEAGRLTVDYGPDREVFLDGQGLELVPSVFLSGPPQLHTRQLHTPRGRAVERTGAEHPAARPVNVMVFPVCSHGLATTALVKDAQRPTRPLPQLLGRTRAAVLERLTRPQSTSELSAALRISVTTASEHASVLRSSGLVSTTRNGSSVLHEVTPLGALMLNSPTEPARTWCRDCDERCAVGGEARELVA